MLLWIVAAPLRRVSAREAMGGSTSTMVDVGQGDAVLVTLPNGRSSSWTPAACRSAARFDIGDRVVGPTLRARGLVSLDYLAITHGDPDHLGGAVALARDFARPREIWWDNPPVPGTRRRTDDVRSRGARPPGGAADAVTRRPDRDRRCRRHRAPSAAAPIGSGSASAPTTLSPSSCAATCRCC